MLQVKIRAQLAWAELDLKIFKVYAGLRIWIIDRQRNRRERRIHKLRRELEKPTIIVGPEGVYFHNAEEQNVGEAMKEE